MYSLLQYKPKKAPWNKGKLVGQKLPLKLKEIWAIRIRLQIDEKHRDLALFNLAIDSKLRACDFLKLRVADVSQGNRVASRAMVMQQKTGQSVQFEITEQTRQAVSDWIRRANLNSSEHLFPSRSSRHTRSASGPEVAVQTNLVQRTGYDPMRTFCHRTPNHVPPMVFQPVTHANICALLSRCHPRGAGRPITNKGRIPAPLTSTRPC